MHSYFVFIALLSIGLSGALFNYVAQVVKGHIGCDFITYVGGAFERTLGSMGAIMAAAIGVMQNMAVDFDNPAVFAAMFSAGFFLDNVINKAPDLPVTPTGIK